MCESTLWTTTLSTCLIYITPTSTRIPLNMPVSLVHFTAFFQGEDKLERGENHFRSGLWKGLGTQVGRWPALSHMRRVVFLVMSIPQLLAKESYNILSNSLHEKLYKKFTDNICYIHCKIQTGLEDNYFLSFTCIDGFST